jgi:hypothetical protein
MKYSKITLKELTNKELISIYRFNKSNTIKKEMIFRVKNQKPFLHIDNSASNKNLLTFVNNNFK